MRLLHRHFLAARHCGFSLVELIVVFAISAILLGMAVPSFVSFLKNQRIGAAANDFMAAINLTRSEAIRRGARVDLVPASGDWSKGWMVFVDANNNQRPDSGETVIYMHGPVPGGITVISRLTDSSAKYLAYNGTGRTRTNANSQSPQFGTFTFQTDGQTRKIVLNMLGRPRACNPATDGANC